MPSGRRAVGPLLLMLTALAACAKDDGVSPTPSSTDGGRNDAGASASEDATAPVPSVPFTLTRDPDPGCVATTAASPRELATAPGAALALTDLQAVGPRRLARDLAGRGFVLFAADGSAPSAAPISVGTDSRAAASASGIVAAGLSASSSVLVQLFDLAGASLGAAQDLGPARLGRPIGVGRSGDAAIVTWAGADDSVRARLVGPTGTLGKELSLESGAPFGDLSFAIAPSSARDGSDFLVLWSLFRVALGAHRVYAALVNAKGVVGLPRVVFGSDVPVRLVSAVSGADGATLLANLDGEPMLVPLDVLGRVTGTAHLLLGARDVTTGGGQGLARNGDEIAVVVALNRGGSSAFRRLDGAGQPKDGWICLGTPRPGDLQLGGITNEGSGYAVVTAGPEGKNLLLRVDATGREPLP